MLISDIIAREIFDSRGEATIEIEIKTSRGTFRAAVPSGKSTGKSEAAVLKFASVKKSVAHIARRIRSKNFSRIEALDSFLTRLDGTERKIKLGGNTLLGISVACARAMTFLKKEEVWQTLRKEFFPSDFDGKAPLVFSNFINGGLHAPGTGIDIQEYMAVMSSGSMGLRVKKLIQLYREVGKIVRDERRDFAILPIGDEAGYAVRFQNNFEPIGVLERAIRALKLTSSCRIAIDAAASSFRSKGGYLLGGRQVNSEDLALEYRDWIKRAPSLFSLEDPFAEDDLSGFGFFKKMTGSIWVVGDDLTATNSRLIRHAARNNLINSVIIKPNQIGTVTETCRAIQAARDHNLKIIVSHRSGETEDNFIIHLAKASVADGIKIGAPCRERVTKFNELIRLY